MQRNKDSALNYETTSEIEYIVAAHLNWRQNIIVPKISWGAGVHECDLFVLSKSGWATEIEIKISAADLKKDALKGHGHHSNRIKYLYFAIPKKLLKYWKHIPKRAGVYVIDTKGGVHKLRDSEKNKSATQLSTDEIANIGRLGVMRYWNGRNNNIANKHDIERLRQQLGPDHQKKCFDITYHRDRLLELYAETAENRPLNWKWYKNYHKRELIEAVKRL